ncbi:MAG: peptide chain release factor N(5)-glutamine methyltransferase, partial [Candidatus Kerfeldbacteria bacterium CG15_BIG_FIL_POST_REV_8_21_14_020_45_12]
MTVAQTIEQAAKEFVDVSTTPRLDAEVLLAEVLKVEASWLLGHSSDDITKESLAQFLDLCTRRQTGEPVAYILGYSEFYGRRFNVSPAVLIPRPETELLIDTALELIDAGGVSAPRILDLGTGSGCISVTLALEVSAAEITATDLSPEALIVAKTNAHAQAASINFYEGDLFDALPDANANSFDMVIMNPPYVDMERVNIQAPESSALVHEPRLALTPDGLPASLVVRVIEESSSWLKASGCLLVEIGDEQGAVAIAAAQRSFPNANIEVRKDL